LRRKFSATFLEDELPITYSSVSPFKRHCRRRGGIASQVNISQLPVEESLRDVSIPGDVILSIFKFKRLMWDHSERFYKPLPLPIVLRSQIYGTLNSRTETDKELELLRKTNEIRLFKLTNRDEFAIMLSKDYQTHIIQTRDAMEECGSWKNLKFSYVDRFLQTVISTYTELYITKQKLVELMKLNETSQKSEIEDVFTALVSVGVLTMKDLDTFWISIPGVGNFLYQILEGRKTILQSMENLSFGEIMMEDLMSKKSFQKLYFDVEIHLKDLIGLGLIERIYVSNGTLLRLPEK